MRIRRVVLNSALLSSFLVYAISPLSYVCPSQPAPALATGQEPSAFGNFSIYLFEEFMKGFLQPQDEDALPPVGSILAIKKHAVVRLSSELRKKPVKSAALAAYVIQFQCLQAEAVTSGSGLQPLPPDSPVYSGLSPPAASA